MTDEQKNVGGRCERAESLAVMVLVLLVLLSVYLVATGPIMWLDQHGYLGDTIKGVIYVVYWPIAYLEGVSDTFNMLFIPWRDYWRQ